jgi:hypothetical protein
MVRYIIRNGPAKFQTEDAKRAAQRLAEMRTTHPQAKLLTVPTTR